MADGVKKINEFIMKDGRVIGITTPDYSASKLEPGTLYIDPGTGKLKYVNAASGNKIWEEFDPAVIFNQQTIVTSLLKDRSVTTQKLADKAVTTIKIGDKQLTTVKYADLSVTNGVLGNSSVDRNKIKDLEVITSKLQNLGVTTDKIKNLAVTSEKIALEDIFNKHIARRTIIHDRLAEKTLTRNEIKNAEIVEELLGPLSVTNSKLGTNSVSEVKILNNNVTHYKLGESAVYGSKVKERGIEDRHIANLHGHKITDGTIRDVELAANSVTTSKILNLSVTMGKLDSSTQTLINEAIRVKTTQNIAGSNVSNTAWCKGHMRIKAMSGQAHLKVDGNIQADGNITGARVYNPVFADIAEGYIPLGKLKPGDPVSLSEHGGLRVEKYNESNAQRFLGFISDEYANCYGADPAEIANGSKVAVALIGRIHVNKDLIIGDVKIGNRVCPTAGKFMACSKATGSSIGKIIDIIGNKVLLQVYPS